MVAAGRRLRALTWTAEAMGWIWPLPFLVAIGADSDTQQALLRWGAGFALLTGAVRALALVLNRKRDAQLDQVVAGYGRGR
jgi:hypothetical protein